MTLEARYKRVLTDLNLLALATREASRRCDSLDEKVDMRRLSSKLARMRCELNVEHFAIEDAGKVVTV